MKNFDKLPKWAQHEVTLLERKIEELQKIVDANNNADTNVTYGIVRTYGLPINSTVSFHTDQFRFDVSILKEGGIRVYSSGTVQIIPQAMNVVTIKTAEQSSPAS